MASGDNDNNAPVVYQSKQTKFRMHVTSKGCRSSWEASENSREKKRTRSASEGRKTRAALYYILAQYTDTQIEKITIRLRLIFYSD